MIKLPRGSLCILNSFYLTSKLVDSSQTHTHIVAIMSTSADTRPIAPERFAAALKDLSVGMLHLKVLEIRNSIAHLEYSNDQLKPFAEGTATALSDSSTPTTAASEPDQDCIDAIKENEVVIDRMAERIALIRAEVEERGVSWTEFQSRDEVASRGEGDAGEKASVEVNGDTQPSETAASTSAPAESRHEAWSDGTFQTGTIRNGEIHMDRDAGRPEGGSLSDEQLQRALEERMRNLETDDDDGGMHL
ncbi:hypothetical protein N0V84_002499 [Fusarium piperis]|uniref:Secondary alcohol dehydrogenase n=1 Tax=Fusarium piperis TaxID=1435070 RepID=A0A9W8WJ56_9HYPO|nr:hypothetical protein N0V84_002499 [Fusarium piperis]